MTNKNKSTLGTRLISLAIVTVIVFLILRLTHVLDWQWVWIFSPLWITMAFNVVFDILKGFIRAIKDWNDINRIR